MRMRDVVNKLAVAVIVIGLSACSGTFRTYYDVPAPSAGWRISEVHVAVPGSLRVSEAESLLPNADIVWREDPPGDRYQQVAAIMENAIRHGSAGLQGARPVRLDVTMTRFHAMTFKAETRAPGGVHDVEFDIVARDAATGQVLAGPEHIEASFPAMTGAAMAAARARGETQKSQITNHVARTIAGWLGIGPDARKTFTSIGG